MKKRIPTISQRVGVLYKISVVENGRVIRSFNEKPNLVLDAGLDRMATIEQLQLTSRAAIGTGTTPVKRDSASTTFSIAGTAVTASGNFFEAGDVGRLLKFDTGEEYYISAYTDPQNVTVSGSGGTHGPSEGTIWYVNQTGLVAETQRTSGTTSGTGENSGTWNSGEGAWEIKRTFLFPTVGAPVTINEIGWSDLDSAGPNLFGRDLVSPGVSLLTGQQLKVTVTLRVYISPTVPTPWTNPITGFGADGDYMFTKIPANNNTTPIFPNFGLSPTSLNFTLYITTNATALPAGTTTETVIISGGSESAGAVMTSAAYVPGTFRRDYTGSIGSGSGNGSSWRAFVILDGNPPASRTWEILMDTPQTKASTHRLDLEFSVAWGRVLVN